MAQVTYDPANELSQIETQGRLSESLKNIYMQNAREEMAEFQRTIDAMQRDAIAAENAIRNSHLAALNDIRKQKLSQADEEKRITSENARYEAEMESQRINNAMLQERKWNEERVKYEQIVQQQKNAIHQAALNDYAMADANTKQQLLEAQLQRDRNELAALNGLRDANVQLSAEQQQRLSQLNSATEGVAATEQRVLAIIEAKRLSEERNVPLAQKIAYYTDLQSKRTAEMERIQAEYNAELAQAEALFDNAEQRSKAVEAAEERRQQQIAMMNAQYGMPHSGIAQTILTSGATIAQGIPGVGGVIDDIKSFSSTQGVGNKIIFAINKLKDIISEGFNAIGTGVQDYLNIETEYLASINTRLVKQESATGKELMYQKNFDNILDNFQSALGTSRYVSQKGLMETLNELVSNGIAYNLEQRTILAELSDKMVSTFDMLDETLTRLTKIQQADMSVAALTTEADITQFLNTRYEDNSYLNSEYDTVAGTLLEASSQLSAQEATEFMYNVQKWLGSLYSLGMSSTGVETIASGINALATGDVDYFNSNDSARTLFALASGGSFSDLLVSGVNADNVNDLLNNIVSYLAQISTDTNQVTRQVKAGLFGDLSLSDIRAVGNLSEEDIQAITNFNYTVSGSNQTLANLLRFAQSNTTAMERQTNVMSNVLYDIGSTIAKEDWGWVGEGIVSLFGLDELTKGATYNLGTVIGGDAGNILQSISLLSSTSTIMSSVNEALKNYSTTLLSLFTGGTITSDWEDLIKERGSSYALATGVISGISPSQTLFSNPSYTESSDTTDNSSSGDNFYTQGNNTVETYSDTTYTGEYSATTLYEGLFVEQLPIRVILAEVENEALSNLTSVTYPVSDAITHVKLDRWYY